MFKQVEYVGFDRSDDLRRLAEGATVILADEISEDWHDQVEVRWAAHAGLSVGVELTVSVDTDIGSGTGSRFIPVADFADPRLLASRCGSAWDRALGGVLAAWRKSWDGVITETVGV